MSLIKHCKLMYDDMNNLIREHKSKYHDELEQNYIDRFDACLKTQFVDYPILSVVVNCIKYNRYDLIDYLISVRQSCLDCIVTSFCHCKDVSLPSKQYFLTLIKHKPCFNVYINFYIWLARYDLVQLLQIDQYYPVLSNVVGNVNYYQQHYRFNTNIDDIAKQYTLTRCLVAGRYDIYDLLVVSGYRFDCSLVDLYGFIGNGIAHHLDNCLINSEFVYHICKEGNLFLLKKIVDRILLVPEYLLVAFQNERWLVVTYLLEQGLNVDLIKHRLSKFTLLKWWFYCHF